MILIILLINIAECVLSIDFLHTLCYYNVGGDNMVHRIQICIEAAFLQEIDDYCDQHNLSRSAFLVQAVKEKMQHQSDLAELSSAIKQLTCAIEEEII